MSKLMIKNIGTLVSGDISNPILKADALLIEGGMIQGIGKEKDLDTKGVDQVMDVQGMTVTPGLIDSHCHPVLGDFTPRQKMLDFIASRRSDHGDFRWRGSSPRKAKRRCRDKGPCDPGCQVLRQCEARGREGS